MSDDNEAKESRESENNEDVKSETDNSKKDPKSKKTSPLFRKIVAGSIFCIILLLGVIVGLVIFPAERISMTDDKNEQESVIAQQEQPTGPRFNALDPVSGDWGITADELITRINVTLEQVGIRGDKIVKWDISESGIEFRHLFSQSLLILGELSEANNVRRVALFFDPAFDAEDFALEMTLMRALISAIDPSLTREEISGMIASLEVSMYEKFPPRQTELRHNKFIFRVWSVAGSAFVFTASSDN